ncbi:MAG: hypothetical protein K6E51_06920 [Treponema sp.]|nr:hypothetical protein [Treponema sp.]
MGIHSSNVHNVSALTSVPVTAKTLREGSVVSVRVLANTAGNTYKAVVAGVTVSLQSECALQKGMVFKALVHGNNGSIFLKPLSPEVNSISLPVLQQMTENAMQGSLSVFTPLTNSQLVAYLQALHLTPDMLSLRLVQQLQQMGARFDLSVLTKIRRIAARFPGKEAAAAEIALQLELQGVDADIAVITSFFNQGDLPDNEEPSAKDQKRKAHNERKIEDSSMMTAVSDALSKYIKTLLTACEQHGHIQSELARFNESSESLHWVVLPFEMEITAPQSSQVSNASLGRGALRFFIDRAKNECKKIILSMELRGQNSFYVLYLKNGNEGNVYCHTVKLCVMPKPSATAAFEESLRRCLQESGEEPISIEWLDVSECTPFFTENTPLSMVSGIV